MMTRKQPQIGNRRRNRRRLLAALLSGPLFGALPTGPRAEEAPPLPIAFVGRWTSSAKHPTAGDMRITVSIAQTLRFSGTATVNGQPFWEYAGTVQIDARTLVWRYESTSIALPEAARTDIDDIVSIGPEQIELRSRRTGALRTLQRLR